VREPGIKVVYLKPDYTSQTCPSCGERNTVKDRNYHCGCGYHAHRDRVGALEIPKQSACLKDLARFRRAFEKGGTVKSDKTIGLNHGGKGAAILLENIFYEVE